jgi:Carboxypeptidase regulatory-like domain
MQFRLRTVAVVCTAIFFSFVAAVQTARAQDITGRLSGTVTDTQGAVIPNATVTIMNEATGVSLPPIPANANGFYVADDLPVGSYTVTATAKGFKTTSVTGNNIVAGGRLTADVQMEVGAVTETVTVTAYTNKANTTSGELQTTLTQQQMLDIPLNQRHYEEAVTLVPGAYVTATGQNAAAIFSGYSNAVSVVNGQRGDGQVFSVDGGFNQDSGSNGSNFNEVGIDFVQELDVQTNNFDAEYGRSSSASINVVTRSGGDQYHGSAFEFLQNNDFNARTSQTKLQNPTQCASNGNPGGPILGKYQCLPAFHFNDYGYAIGGPVPYIQAKGKLFIFAGQEWRKFRGSASGLQAATETTTFPTMAEAVNHNFTDTGVALVVPAGAPAGCTIVANTLSANCITTDGAAIDKLYESAALASVNRGLPNSATSGNLQFNLPNPGNTRDDIIRADEHANDHQSLYFRYLHDFVQVNNPYSTFGPSPSNGLSQVPVDPDSRHRPGTNLQFGWTDIISPSLINEFKINADWHSQTTPLTSLAGNGLSGPSFLASTYGFAFLPPLGQPPAFPSGLPTITFTATGTAAAVNGGVTEVAGPAINFLASPTADINPIDNVTWVKNNHTIKFGIEFARNRKEQNSRANANGIINFSTGGNNTSGFPFADALMGTYNTVSQTSSNPVGQFRFNVEDAFIQDTWKFNRRLSIVMGVRFSHTTPLYAQGNNMTQFDPLVGTPGGYIPAAAATFTSFGTGTTISAASHGLCPVQLITVPGMPTGSIYCNGLTRPAGVPADQAGRVQVTQLDPVLLASIPGTAQRGFYLPENLFAPRFGFSYSPFGDKTVVRGGFGIFYDHPEGNVLCNGIACQGYAPWTQTTTITATGIGGFAANNLATFDSPATAAVPAPSSQSVSTVDPRLKVARSYQYSLSVQRELPQDMLLQIGYVGTLGRHVLRGPVITDPAWTSQQLGLPGPAAPNPNTYQCPATTILPAYGCTIPAGGTSEFANAAIQSGQLSPYLGYATADAFETGDVNSNYNAAQLQLTKRTGFLTTSVAYTYSKYLSDGGGVSDAYNENGEPECPYTCLVSTAYDTTTATTVAGGTLQAGPWVAGTNPVQVTTSPTANGICTGGVTGFIPAYAGCQTTGGVVESWRKFYYGLTSVNATHIIAASFTVQSPWGKGSSGLEALAIKGWSVTGIVHYQTGSPSTVTDNVPIGDFHPKGGFGATRRASIVPGVPIYNAPGCVAVDANCWVNANAFRPETQLAAGDAPVGDIIGPAFYQWDITVQKTFILPWRDGMNFQIRADGINVFNQDNFTNSYKSLTPLNGSFGQVNATNPGRIVQLGGKFNF